MIDQYDEEFHEQRLSGIGGSDIGAILNLDFGCARRTWYKKRSTEPDYPKETSAAMKRGIRLEEVAAEEYSIRTGRTQKRMPFKQHKDHPELIVHGDRMVIAQDITGGDQLLAASIIESKSIPTGLLEIKVPGTFMFKKNKTEGVSEATMLQLQHGLGITGWEWDSPVIFEPSSWEMLYWDVERDDELIEMTQRKAIEFWGLVQNGPAPDRLEPDDRRCHRCEFRTSCQGEALVQLAGKQEVTDIEQDPTIDDVFQAYLEAKELEAEAKELVNIRRAPLEKAIGDRPVVEVTGHRIFYRVRRGGMYVDAKKLKKEHPLIYADSLYERKGTRPLRYFPI